MSIRPLIDLVEAASVTPEPILMWHGARNWEGSPEVRGAKQGRYEAGPGLYCTTSYETARKYSKGGGSTMLLTLKPGFTLAENVKISLDAVNYFVSRCPRMPKKADIIADMFRIARRTDSTWKTISANVLINLVVNYEAGAGKVGLALAAFLVEHGVDAALEKQSGDEQWLVIFNPKIIKSAVKVPADQVSMEMRYLPKIG